MVRTFVGYLLLESLRFVQGEPNDGTPLTFNASGEVHTTGLVKFKVVDIIRPRT